MRTGDGSRSEVNGARLLAPLVLVGLTIACSTGASWETRVRETCGRLYDLRAARGCIQLGGVRADYVDTCSSEALDQASGTTAAQLEKCLADFTASSGCAQVESCSPAPGRQGVGAFCAFDSECQSRHCSGKGGASCGRCVLEVAEGEVCDSLHVCDAASACIEGQCRRYAAVPLGASCAGSSSCRDSFCDPKTRVCVPFGVVGSTCTSIPCGFTLWCDDGVCAERIPSGAACKPDSYGCQGRAFCDPETSTCTPVRFAAEGEPCSLYVVCKGAASCVDGVCRDPPRRGERCGSASTCAPPLVCINLTCSIEDPGRCSF